MQNSSSFSWWKRVILMAIGINFLAFVTPQKDDLVELTGWIQGRDQAKFRKTDKNKLFTLKPKTRGIIVETKYFETTKNYGVCLQIMNSTDVPADQRCTWVYFNSENPNMNLYSLNKDAKNHKETLERWTKEKGDNLNQVKLLKGAAPAVGLAAQTTRSVTGVSEAKLFAPGNAPALVAKLTDLANPQMSVDSDSALKTALGSISLYNNKAQKAMTSTSSANFCVDCATKLQAYPTCNSSNDYMQNEISRIVNSSPLSPILAGNQKEIIRKACFQRSLDTYPNLKKAYRNCQPGETAPQGFVEKACVSEDYTAMTTNSFNAVAECMSDYVSGNAETKKETALAVFSLTSWESGLHVNAGSPTGAGGIGQFTEEAIDDVNSRMKIIREHLTNSKNPNCNKKVLLDVLKTPMEKNINSSCARTSLSKDNPLKNMIYTFAYQGSQRQFFEQTILNSPIFSGILSSSLLPSDRERLATSITIWSHNTGPKGMSIPLKALTIEYLTSRKSVKTSADVDQFLTDLQQAMARYPAVKKENRIRETSTFFSKIQGRISQIAKEPRQCLAD